MNGLFFCVLLPAANWKDTSIIIQFYDNIGDLYIDGLQLTRNDVQTRTYNSAGKLTSSYTTQKSTSYTYDNDGNVTKKTAAIGGSIT